MERKVEKKEFEKKKQQRILTLLFLFQFLAANEPQLLAVSNLTAAHHLISRFVAGIQKTKHTSGGPHPLPSPGVVTASAAVSALPQSLASHYLDQSQQQAMHQQTSVSHLVRGGRRA